MGAGSSSSSCLVKNRLGRAAELAVWPALSSSSSDSALPEDDGALCFEGFLGQGLERPIASDAGADGFWVAVRATLAQGQPSPSSSSSSSSSRAVAARLLAKSKTSPGKPEAPCVQRLFVVRLPNAATLELRDYGGPGLARICREGSSVWEVPDKLFEGSEVWSELDRRRGRRPAGEAAAAPSGSSPSAPSASSSPSPSSSVAPDHNSGGDAATTAAAAAAAASPTSSQRSPEVDSSSAAAAAKTATVTAITTATEPSAEGNAQAAKPADEQPAAAPASALSVSRRELCCPISHEPFEDPVLAADGFTYERRCIEEWMGRRGLLSPMTGADMPSGALVPNLVMRSDLNGSGRPTEAPAGKSKLETPEAGSIAFYGEHLPALWEMFPDLAPKVIEEVCRQLLAEGIEDLDRLVRRLLEHSSDAVSLAPVCCEFADPPVAGKKSATLDGKDFPFDDDQSVPEAWSDTQRALFLELLALEFPAVRARKAIEVGLATELEEAVAWIELHQDDDEIDVPLEKLEERETHQLALDVMRIATIPAVHRLTCFQALHGILGRILNDPESQRLRQIRLKNVKFRQQVGRFRPAVRLLRSVGFQRGEYWASATEKEACLEFKLPVDSDNPVSKRFVRAFSLLEEVLNHPDDYLSSIGEAQQEVSALPERSAAAASAQSGQEAPTSVEEILDRLDADAETFRRELRAQLHERRVKDPRGYQEAMKAAGRTPNKVIVDLRRRPPSAEEEEVASRLVRSSTGAQAGGGGGGQHRSLEERYPGQRHFNLQDLEAMRIEDAIASCPSYASDYAASKGSASNYLELVARSYDPEYLGRKAVDESNYFRASEKRPPLKWCPPLAAIAEEHAQQMARGEMPFSHKGFDDRVRRYPFAYLSAAENLAYNSGVADAARVAVDGWIKSPGHRKNLLGAFDLCGIGVARSSAGQFFFTQLFARSVGGALC